MHGSALDIIKKYQEVLGVRPKLPPFWSLGWMQASYKWSTQQMVEDVVGNYSDYNMPLDTVFLDIPYMDNYVDFTVNPVNFTNLPQFIKKLHDNKQQIVPIIDAGISAEDINNKYYKIGNTDDIFIKSGIHKSTKYNNNLINEVWPKIAVFVDWFNQKCTNMWFTGLRDLYDKLPYDGIWIDMNEPWGFQTAELNPNNLTDRPRSTEQRSRRSNTLLFNIKYRTPL
jgi:alpha-glucosidase (family GH31 glycosyl hydrolase)